MTLDYPFGSQRRYAMRLLKKASKGMRDEETIKLLERLIELRVIDTEKESAIAIFVRVCEALAKQEFPFDKFKNSKNEKGKLIYKTLADIKEECHIDMDKVMEEAGVTLDYPFGSQRKYAVSLLKEASKGMRDEETIKLLESLIKLGVIKDSKNYLEQAKKERDAAEEKNEKVKELEKQTEQQLNKLKKRRNDHEKQ